MHWLLFVIGLTLLPSLAHAQPELRSGKVGATPARPVTSQSIDADTNAVDTYFQGIRSGVAIPTSLPTVSSANDDGSCPSGAASFTVLASNTSRRWATFWASPANSDDVYVKFGATATTSDARLSPGMGLFIGNGVIYTGRIDAIPASGTQAVCVVELN